MKLQHLKMSIAGAALMTAPAANACLLDGFGGGRHSPFGAMGKGMPNLPVEIDSSGYPLLPSEQSSPVNMEQDAPSKNATGKDDGTAAKTAEAPVKTRQSALATQQAPVRAGKPTKD